MCMYEKTSDCLASIAEFIKEETPQVHNLRAVDKARTDTRFDK